MPRFPRTWLLIRPHARHQHIHLTYGMHALPEIRIGTTVLMPYPPSSHTPSPNAIPHPWRSPAPPLPRTWLLVRPHEYHPQRALGHTNPKAGGFIGAHGHIDILRNATTLTVMHAPTHATIHSTPPLIPDACSVASGIISMYICCIVGVQYRTYTLLHVCICPTQHLTQSCMPPPMPPSTLRLP